MTDRDDPRPWPYRPGPDIPPRPGQAAAALAEVMRRRRRKAVVATTIALGVVTGAAVLALTPRHVGGDDDLRFAETSRSAGPVTGRAAAVSTSVTATPQPSRASGSPTSPSVRATRPGRHQRSTVVAPQAARASDATVAVDVRDPNGQPVSGITAYAAGPTFSVPVATTDADGMVQVSCDVLAHRPLMLADPATGTWAWQLVGAGTTLSAAQAPACGAHEVAVLVPATTVSGYYTRDGVASPGVVIGVTCTDAPALPFTAVVGPDGSFTLGGLAPGSCVLTHDEGSTPCATDDEPSVMLDTTSVRVDVADTGCSAVPPPPTSSSGPPTPTPTTAPPPPTTNSPPPPTSPTP